MLYSMTGYGKCESITSNNRIVVEIKSLNSRTNEIRLKLPSGYSEKELELRNLILSRLIRGKIDVNIINDLNSNSNIAINGKLFKEYYRQLNQIADELGENNRDYFPSIVRIPNVFKESDYVVTDEDWNATMQSLENAIHKLVDFRVNEGLSLQQDILNNLGSIMDRFDEVDALDEERKRFLRERMDTLIKGMEQNNKIDKDRFEQEVLFYLEKLDINEEKSRLKQHCIYFQEVVADDNLLDKGKKLSFITQEIGREINTLGAKAQFSELQKIVVEMKDNLEKIKEQLANVL
ncbi:MAG: DUF1732 domain-containing protein [Saprospiraceae bacterium]